MYPPPFGCENVKHRVREAIAGYVMSAPIIITILTFTIIPVFKGLYYSFTDYDALLQQKYNYTFEPDFALRDYLLISPDEDVKLHDLLGSFDPIDFVEYTFGFELTEEQKNVILKYFKKRKLLEDFVNGKLKNRKMRFKDFMKTYLERGKELFSKYKPKFIGLENFKKLIDDRYFWISLKNSILFSLVVTPIQSFLALILAIAANQRIRGVKFFKITFFIPSITSSAAISMIFMLLYSKPGLINRILGIFGIPAIDWLGNTKTALPAIMAMNIWTTSGYFMITFLAGLQNIPSSVIEASEIDGARGWTRFWKIILPLLKPQMIYVVTLGMIGTLQVFDQIYFLIRSQENVTMSMYIYQNAFSYGKMGYASSIALVFFLIILLATFVQRQLMREEKIW